MTTPDFAFRREQDDDDRPPPGAEPEPQDGDETPAGTGQEETRDGFFGRLGGFFRPGAVIDTAVAQNRSSDLIAAGFRSDNPIDFVRQTAQPGLFNERFYQQLEVHGVERVEAAYACLLYTSPSPRDS